MHWVTWMIFPRNPSSLADCAMADLISFDLTFDFLSLLDAGDDGDAADIAAEVAS